MQNYKRAVLATGILLAALMTSEAALADCSPLKLIASVDLQPTQDKRREFIPVKIAGQSRYMVLDTGAAMTTISNLAVNDLGLKLRHGNFEMINVSGGVSSQFTETSFELGNLKADDVAFVLMPDSEMLGDNKNYIGLLGSDILKHYDVSIDFGTDKFDLLSQDHCEGKVVYWAAPAVAVVPIRVLRSGEIVLPVTLDGKTVYATLDTGASSSTLAQDAVESDFGLKLGSPDTPAGENLFGKKNEHTYAHTFKTLDFEGIAISNPHFEIIPDMMRNSFENTPRTGSHIPNPDNAIHPSKMLLGMDILRHLHIYIAYKEEKLYVTPAGMPGAPDQASSASAAPSAK